MTESYTATYAPGRPERNGWIMGLTMPQALICVGAFFPLVLLFGSNRPGTALALLPAAALVVALAAVPVRPMAASMRIGYQTSPQTDAPSMIANVGHALRRLPLIAARRSWCASSLLSPV